MSRVCDICGKMPHSGNNVSHSNRKTKRVWRPNLQRTRIQTPSGTKHARVCTSCLSSGKVTRPMRRTPPPSPESTPEPALQKKD